MAILEHPERGRSVVLRAQTLVGRSRTCDLQLDDPAASSQHALLRWVNRGWELRDLGSRNGTHVDGRRLEPGERVTLDAGARIGFGRPAGWLLTSDGPPVASARCDGREVHAEGGMLSLPPDAELPEVVVYWAGAQGWVAERDSGLAPAGETIEVGAHTWQLHLPAAVESTLKVNAPSVHTLGLHFQVSRDEESTSLRLRFGGTVTPLTDRSHHYLLLTLARQRLEDRQLGVGDDEEGWLDHDALARGLRVTSRQVNLQVHRARRQLVSHGVVDAAQLVERRVTARQLRLGVRDVTIERL